jgi:glutamine cyclotransferase
LAGTSCSTSAARPTLTETTLSPTTVSAEQTNTTIPQSHAIDVEPLTGTIRYTVVASYPHDNRAFTQGLEFIDGLLYESTGRRGESDRRIVDPETGSVLAEVPLDESLFGEGMTERNGLLYQLTYTSGLLLVSDTESLDQVGEPLRYDGEGWGLCAAESEPGQPFIMSNGTSELTIRDPRTFDVLRTVPVTDEDGTPVSNLNELECFQGWVLANVWKSNDIVSVDLATGQVMGRLDLTDLVPPDLDDNSSALNGIAYRPGTDSFFVTGKLWPVGYELRLSSG